MAKLQMHINNKFTWCYAMGPNEPDPAHEEKKDTNEPSQAKPMKTSPSSNMSMKGRKEEIRVKVKGYKL